ncbi:BT4734/BF3469 family protein [Polaribacter sp. BM10]|uniref:BT4734/BF3469 family protein n=1 Tax=Polaribacter sp. BM10 TaxID=1529069 RepID=UPI00098AC34A|nr:BT4734/BF3469 family protein [Polaribacter sp. BM10]
MILNWYIKTIFKTLKIKVIKNYFYFATHTKSKSIFARLEASVWFKGLTKKEQETVELFAKNYKAGYYKDGPIDYCIDFIDNHKVELSKLLNLEECLLKFSLEAYLQFYYQWGASTKPFGKNSNKRAEMITEQKLIKEMTDPNGSIKKLLHSVGEDLSAVKPFLPTIMISLDTNTRNKKIMEFKHTGRFCFDFDGLKDSKEAISWMNKVWQVTKNLKPNMGFLSPRGKGFKLFFKVDTFNEEFINDFSIEERSIVMNNHKIWYEGARKELAAAFPNLEDKIDESTNDPQRLMYIPFISNPTTKFKYSPMEISQYSSIVEEEKRLREQSIKDKIAKNKAEIKLIMADKNIKSETDAYNFLNRSKNESFNYEFEMNKLKKVIEFILELSKEDDRVKGLLKENFTNYQTLQKISWVLYGVFGKVAIDEIKKLIPAGSNKLDQNHGDYRWTNISDNQYNADGDNSRANLTRAPFYSLIFKIAEIKKFVLRNFLFTSKDVNDFNLINKFYDQYKYNLDLKGDDLNNADETAFLEQLKKYLNDKKIRLPLIKDLEELPTDVNLDPNDYLDKNVMENLFKVKYADKRIFSLRSQCGTILKTVPSQDGNLK